VEALRSRGLGLGADHNNTLVIDNGTVVGNALRFQNEFVRHKILDLLGDLFLLGADLDARIVATKTGHHANRELVRRLMDDMQARETRGQIARDTGMEIKEILNLLPHRYPFLLIDRVIELEGYRRAVGIKNVSINEPFFQGHWPGQPIMPGVLIIEAMAQLAGVLLLRRLENTGKLAVLWSIDKVKLRKSVVPGDQLRIEIEALKVRDKMGQVAAKGKVNQRLVAEAVLTFTLVDA
jgi:UDP-3-O-[3-hydroxymyristoyl] N-acetylglucosamine deacetylase/3-hydroxyacyl-[acyl-carrier-protein] dehydratase